jgi:hypothetical protein
MKMMKYPPMQIRIPPTAFRLKLVLFPLITGKKTATDAIAAISNVAAELTEPIAVTGSAKLKPTEYMAKMKYFTHKAKT